MVLSPRTHTGRNVQAFVHSVAVGTLHDSRMRTYRANGLSRSAVAEVDQDSSWYQPYRMLVPGQLCIL